jgi:hypothetical protein
MRRTAGRERPPRQGGLTILWEEQKPLIEERCGWRTEVRAQAHIFAGNEGKVNPYWHAYPIVEVLQLARQQIMLGANSKDQIKFVHYELITDILLNSPKLLAKIGRRTSRRRR